VLADPPVLVSPIGGAQASPTPLLQWTPSNPPAPGLQYQVTVKVRYRGQTPAQAMASNPVRLQATVPTTSYQVPLTEQLGVDATDPNYAGHVWQVQALLNGRPYGRDNGLSQVEWFVIREADPAAAQVNVTLQLPFAQMPARVAEWRENESLIRIVVQNTGREQYEGLMLSVELSKDGRRIARSRDGHPAQPRFSLKPGETRSLSWREVISEEAVEYDGSIRQQVAATGELPEGQYRLCIQPLNVQLRPIGPQACGSFGIEQADPPVLVSPIRGAQASVMPLLQWRPSNPPAPGLEYQVTVKVRYRGQRPAEAMASNPVRLQATVPTTSYQVPTEQLGDDTTDPNYAGHVWQVQALLNGRPYGRDNGLSQVEWFVIREADPPVLVSPIRGARVSPTPLLQWTPSNPPVPGLLQYQVTVKVRYRGQTPAQAMASNPVRLQVTVPMSYQVPATEQLVDDIKDPRYAGHVWQVQALLNGRPYGRNNGLSQVEWFVIPEADPPVLVSPINGAQVFVMPLLQWRPSNPPALGLQYQVTVKVRYRGQTPEQAMANNPVRLQVTVPTTSYQVPVRTAELWDDAADPNYAGHVWQVQALLNGRPYGRNSGLSQIEWFVVPNARPPVLMSPFHGEGQLPPTPLLQWRPSNPPVRGLQYQVTVKVRYRGQTPEQAMASNPVRLQVTVPTTSYQVPVTARLWSDAERDNYAGHVWQVQALLNGHPYGRNNGLSQIYVFSMFLPDPPRLIWPANGWGAGASPTLQWTQTRPFKPPPGLQYQVTVKVLYRGQTLEQAMANNPVRLQATVPGTCDRCEYRVPPTARLQDDTKDRSYVGHVWQVRMLLNGYSYGRNRGLSKIEWFKP
jgi:hypothetical protein